MMANIFLRSVNFTKTGVILSAKGVIVLSWKITQIGPVLLLYFDLLDHNVGEISGVRSDGNND